MSDIVHGNIREGASKIWDAERPHVVQGSPLEKAIQTVDPNFHGSTTQTQVAADAAANPLAHSPVDVAQFIDKDKHPIAKAVMETAQSLTTPNNVAILVSSGGLGMVDSPAALGMANRLLSAGFSAGAIAQAYKNLTAFKEAYDKGDDATAQYQLTHALLSGTLGILAGRSATEGASPSGVSDAISDVVRKVNPFRARILAKQAADQAAAAAAADSGVAAGAPPSVGGMRPALDDPIASVANRERATYDKLNRLAGTDMKTLYDRVNELSDSIDDAPIADKPALEKQLDQTRQQIEAGENAVAAHGEDAQTLLKSAKADTQQRYALQELKKQFFNNEAVVEGDVNAGAPEKININNAIKAVYKLDKPSRWTPEGTPSRLEQALGEDGAANLKRALQAAKQRGNNAVAWQTFVKWVPIAGGILGGLFGAYEIGQHFAE